MSEFKEWASLILVEVKRQDQNHRDVIKEIGKVRDKLTEQGGTLIRNTLTLEEHVKRTNLLEKKFDHIEEEVQGNKEHIGKFKTVFELLKPTKTKIKVLVTTATILASVYGGKELMTPKKIKATIEKIEEVLE